MLLSDVQATTDSAGPAINCPVVIFRDYCIEHAQWIRSAEQDAQVSVGPATIRQLQWQ